MISAHFWIIMKKKSIVPILMKNISYLITVARKALLTTCKGSKLLELKTEWKVETKTVAHTQTVKPQFFQNSNSISYCQG